MKTKIFNFMAVSAVAAAVLFSSCTKEDTNNGGNGGIKDPNQDGNGNSEQVEGCLNGSKYAVYILDEGSRNSISSKIMCDLSVNDVDRFLYLWDGTYVGGTSTGLNMFGDAQPWVSIVVSDKGWSGAGICNPATAAAPAGVDALGQDIMANLDSWKLHLAYKNSKENVAQLISFMWGGQTYKFAIGADYIEYSPAGDGSIIAKHTAVTPKSGKFVLNEWNEYEISLKDMGIDFSKPWVQDNYLVFNTDPVQGNTLDIDALFLYR